jgi:hypothetical protein
MSLFTFTDADKKKAQGGTKFEPTAPHPEGEYDGKIKTTKVKAHPTKGEYVLLVVETRAGTAFSSMYFNDKTVAFKNEDGAVTFSDLAKKELKKIILSAYKKGAKLPTKIESLVDVAHELMGLPVRVKVTHKQYNGKTYTNVRYGLVNEIDRIAEKPKLKQEGKVLTKLMEQADEAAVEADDNEFGF